MVRWFYFEIEKKWYFELNKIWEYIVFTYTSFEAPTLAVQEISTCSWLPITNRPQFCAAELRDILNAPAKLPRACFCPKAETFCTSKLSVFVVILVGYSHRKETEIPTFPLYTDKSPKLIWLAGTADRVIADRCCSSPDMANETYKYLRLNF